TRSSTLRDQLYYVVSGGVAPGTINLIPSGHATASGSRSRIHSRGDCAASAALQDCLFRTFMNPVSTLDALYRWMLRPYLFGLDAKSAHRLTLSMLSAMPPFSIPKDPPELAVKLWGIDFSNPVG